MSNLTPPLTGDWPPGTRYLRFGEFRVDLVQARLLRGEETVELPARAFDVLALLVRTPHRLLTREAIFKAVWKNQIVEDANLTQTIWLLRRALGDDDKRHIRTVAKRGYVFAPDDAVTAELELRRVEPARAPVEQEPPRSRRTVRLFGLALALVAVVVLAGLALRLLFVPPAPQSVIIVDYANASAEPALPLVREWLRWKLSVLRPVEIAGAGSVPHDEVDTRRVVLLSSLRKDDGWQVDAQVFGGPQAQHFGQAGTGKDIAPAADALVREVVEAITGETDRDPPLAIGPDAAERFVAAAQARERGSRRTQIEELRKAVEAAPACDWLRAQLVDALADLGQIRAASAVMAQNQRWLEALPEETREARRALWLAETHHATEAAAIYERLVRQRPRSPQLRMAQARALIADQRLREAAQALDAIDPAALPTEQHIEWLQLHKPYDYYLVSTEAARKTLRAIVELAGDTPRHALQRAVAEGEDLLLALQSSGKAASQGDVAGIDATASRIAAAGSPIDAALLRLDAATLRPADRQSLDARLAEALALTRSEGDVDNELLALVTGAFAYARDGDIVRERALYNEFEAVVRANDHVAGLRDAQKFLGQEALYSGRYEEAQRRLESIRDALPAPQVGIALAALHTAQGRYDDADRAADLADSTQLKSQKPVDGASPARRFGVDCWRGETRYARGKLGEAHLSFNACAGESSPRVALAGRIGLARVDYASGRTAQARTQALAARADLADVADTASRMRLAVVLAQLLADLGEGDAARDVSKGLIDFAHVNGLAPLEARARTAAMQLALGAGDPEGARAEYEAATAVAPGTDWQVRSRLRLLHALLARRTGDAATAEKEAASIAADALAHGDVPTELAAISLAGKPGDRERQLVALTGARGVLLRGAPESR